MTDFAAIPTEKGLRCFINKKRVDYAYVFTRAGEPRYVVGICMGTEVVNLLFKTKEEANSAVRALS